jgi:hypothetical protein
VADYAFHDGAVMKGPYSVTGIQARLEDYERDHPDDPHFSRVSIVEIEDEGMGKKMTAAEFLAGPGAALKPRAV